jgi:TP901 family phage tail tape measure protein
MAKSIASTNISIGANLSGLKRGLNIAGRSLKRFGASAKRVGSSISRNISLPFAFVGAASVKMASDLEGSFGKIENLVGITGKALDDFKTSVKNVSSATGQSQQELSEAMFTISSAGLRGAEATEVLERAAKASAIGLGETQQVAQALTGVLQAYSKEGLTAAEATDTLTAIIREGNLEAESLAPTLGRIVGIGAQLGISFQELGANIATFTRLGVPAEEAVVGLRGIMTTFLKPTKEAEIALGQLGLTSEDVRKKLGSEGLQSTLAFLMEGFKGNDEALASVFGNVRALSNVLGTAGAQGETYAAVLDNISNSTGIVDEGFKNVSEESGFKFKQTLNEIKNTGIELGNMLLPLVLKITKFISGAVKAFSDLSTETKVASLAFFGLVALSGPIITAIGLISTAFGLFATSAAAAWTALSGPIGITIAAIVLAGVAVYQFWDIIRPVLVGAINYVIDLYNEFAGVRAIIEGLKYIINNTFLFFGKAISGLSAELINLGDLLIGIFTFDWDRVTAAMANFGDSFVKDMKAYFEEASAAGDAAIAQVTDPKKKIEFVTEEGLQKGIDDFVEPVKKAWENIKNMFSFGVGSTPTTPTTPTTTPTPKTNPKETEAIEEKLTALQKLKKAYEDMGAQAIESSQLASEAIVAMVDSVIQEGIMRLGESLVTGKDAFKGFGVFVLQAFATTAEQLGKMAISIGFTVEAIKKALTNLGGPGAIAAGVALLVLAGAARGKMKQIAESQGQVKLAKGGLAYGETLAVVGDNPNARMDPEVIAPLSKLKNMIGQSGAGGAVTVYGKISGQDILLSSEKASRTRSRYRGF